MIDWRPSLFILGVLPCVFGCTSTQDRLSATSLAVEGTGTSGFPAATAPAIDVTVLTDQWGAAAVDPQGGVFVVHAFELIDNPDVVAPYPTRRYFELRHANASGVETWARTLLGFSLRGVLAPTEDQPVLFGSFSGSVTIDRISLESVHDPEPEYGNALDSQPPSAQPMLPSEDGVVIGFEQGTLAWAQTFKGAGTQEVTAGAVLQNGDLLVGGSFVSDMRLEWVSLADGDDTHGSPVLANPLDSLHPSAFLARLSSDGEYQTLSTFAGGRLLRLASNGEGTVAAVTLSELPDFTYQEQLTFISSDGQVKSIATWSSTAAGVSGLAVDDAGNVYLSAGAGDFHEDLFFGELLINEAAIAKLNPAGEVVWFKRFSALHNQVQLAIRHDTLAIAGAFPNIGQDGIDLGGGLLRAESLSDIFFAEFDLDGNHSYSIGMNGGKDGGGVTLLLSTVQGWLMEFYVSAGVTLGPTATTIPMGDHLMFWKAR